MAPTHGGNHDLGSIACIEAAHECRQVNLDGALGECQRAADGLGGIALGQVKQNIALAGSKAGAARRGWHIGEGNNNGRLGGMGEFVGSFHSDLAVTMENVGLDGLTCHFTTCEPSVF